MQLIERIKQKMFEPVDIASIVFFRIAFGLVMAATIMNEISLRAGYYLYTVPKNHFHYYLFQFLEPLPGEHTMHALYFVLFIAAVLIALGWKYRFATITFFIIYSYIFFLEPGYFRNHPYLISLLSFLLIFIPANRTFSIDALQKPNIKSDITARWHLFILQFQIGLVYFFAGIVKIHPDWLSGYVISNLIYDANSRVIDYIVTQLLNPQLMAYGAMCFDLFVIPLILWKRTRVLALGMMIVFHGLNFFLFDLDNFPYLMMAAALLYFDPSLPRTILRKLGIKHIEDADKSAPRYFGTKKKLTFALLSIYIFIQLVLPLRHYFYPGDYRWTEEGAQFAWTMFGRIKEIAAIPRFTVYDYESQTIFSIDLFAYLHYADRKTQLMVYNPAMIHEFAWIVAKDLVENQGFTWGQFELKADILVSLNGHQPQQLIDPNFDLLSEKPFTLKHRDWIMPFIRDEDR